MKTPNFKIPKSIDEARAVQDALRKELKIEDDFRRLDLIAGIDCGYDVKNNLAHASIVTMMLGDLKPIEQVQAFASAEFPYVPGFLAFREIPAILAALAKLKAAPDLLMVDGQGIAHPRRIGIATHLGLLLDMPAIGVGKSRLTGRFDPPGFKRGDISPLTDKGEIIGYVLRSKEKTNPLFVSPGHRVSLKTAIDITLQCVTRYRLPEPTRMADKLSKLKKVEENLLL